MIIREVNNQGTFLLLQVLLTVLIQLFLSSRCCIVFFHMTQMRHDNVVTKQVPLTALRPHSWQQAIVTMTVMICHRTARVRRSSRTEAVCKLFCALHSAWTSSNSLLTSFFPKKALKAVKNTDLIHLPWHVLSR